MLPLHCVCVVGVDPSVCHLNCCCLREITRKIASKYALEPKRALVHILGKSTSHAGH